LKHAQPRQPRRRGFTLVEILIVVVILGILAAIVIPQFSSASESARSTAMASQLQTLRIQLELYRIQHQEGYPKLAEMWVNLLKRSDTNGTVSDTGKYGPYLKFPPVNSYTNSTTLVAAGAATATDGFTYDQATGQIAGVGFDEATGRFTAPGP
jgi:general secretion pathway protein G